VLTSENWSPAGSTEKVAANAVEHGTRDINESCLMERSIGQLTKGKFRTSSGVLVRMALRREASSTSGCGQPIIKVQAYFAAGAIPK
jgi:hypothetical protein